jgi:hypothetical protein
VNVACKPRPTFHQLEDGVSCPHQRDGFQCCFCTFFLLLVFIQQQFRGTTNAV